MEQTRDVSLPYDASMRNIARIPGLKPRHFAALSDLGLINWAMGRLKIAIRAFRKVVEIDLHLPAPRDKFRDMKKVCATEKLKMAPVY